MELLHRSISLISNAIANEASNSALLEAKRGAGTSDEILKESKAVRQEVDAVAETSPKTLEEWREFHESVRDVAMLGEKTLQTPSRRKRL